MPRNMSFAATIEQFKSRQKDVTRRLGWDWLRPGELLWGVEKAMGLPLGEKVVRLGLIEVVCTSAEKLLAISDDEVRREGFPEWSRSQFIRFFCTAYGIEPDTIVNRIEFRYIGHLATREMIEARKVPGRDAEVGELVFCSTEMCREWAYTRPFYVSVRTLRRWAELADLDNCRENYLEAISYYERAYNLKRSTVAAEAC